MSKLEELINQLCPDGVEYVKIGDICKLSSGGDVPKENFSKEKTEEFNIPIYSNGIGKNALYGYTNIEKVKAPCVTISARGTIGYCELREESFFPIIRLVCAIPKDGLNAKFLKYCIDIIKFSIPTTGIPQLTVPMVSKYSIPLPPLPIQEEIVRIIDNMTSLTAELTAELKARQKQYEYYRDSLLSFDEDNAKDGVRWMKLQDIADIGTGSSNTNEELEEGLYPFFVRSQQVRRKNNYEFDETAIITSGDGVGVGKIFHYVEGKYALHQRAYRIHINTPNVFPKYFFYFMKTTFLRYIEKNSFHSSVTSIRRPMLNNYPVPVPSLEEQQRIVDILDRFDKLCNDISEGLPAEIEARKKQYEYYRDKLLTFKEKEA